MKPENVEQYIASFPEPAQSLLDRIRSILKSLFPDGEECISYGVACFKKGKRRIYYAGFRKHLSLYPAPRSHPEFTELLKPFKGGKGTLQFPLDKPLNESLIKKVAKHILLSDQ